MSRLDYWAKRGLLRAGGFVPYGDFFAMTLFLLAKGLKSKGSTEGIWLGQNLHIKVVF